MKRGKFALLCTVVIMLVLFVAVATAYFFGGYNLDSTEIDTHPATQVVTEMPTQSPTQIQTQPDEIAEKIENMTLTEK